MFAPYVRTQSNFLLLLNFIQIVLYCFHEFLNFSNSNVMHYYILYHIDCQTACINTVFQGAEKWQGFQACFKPLLCSPFTIFIIFPPVYQGVFIAYQSKTFCLQSQLRNAINNFLINPLFIHTTMPIPPFDISNIFYSYQSYAEYCL